MTNANSRRIEMDDKKKLELLEDLLEVDEGTLSPQMELSELDEWDSMAALSLIVMIDDECGKRINGDDIRKLVTIKDIMDIME